MAEELIAFASKGEMLAKSKEFWNPAKTQFWKADGAVEGRDQSGAAHAAP